MTLRPSRTLLTLAPTAALALALGCAELQALGDLSGLGSQEQPVSCTITGQLVGADGASIERLDVAWYPAERLSTSEQLFDGQADGSRFTITQLVIPKDATVVKGELGFNQQITPPNPQRYQQVRIALDLPASACNKDLGQVELPMR